MTPIKNDIVSVPLHIQIARFTPNMRRGVELVDWRANFENVEESIDVDHRVSVNKSLVFNLGFNKIQKLLKVIEQSPNPVG